MSIFHWLRGSTEEPQLNAALKRRLDELEEENRLAQKRMKAIELDSQEWYDKFRLLYARLVKRIKDAANAEPDTPQSTQDAPEPTIDRLPGYGQTSLPINGQRPRRNY